MIAVKETKDGTIERIGGNPTLLSLDGKEKAPLLVVLHNSWSAADRARFGVFLVEPATVPDGKRVRGAPAYQRQGDTVVEVRELEDIPAPAPDLRTPAEKVEAMAARFGLTIDELRAVLADGGKA